MAEIPELPKDFLAHLVRGMPDPARAERVISEAALEADKSDRLSLPHAAELYRVSLSTLRRKVKSGDLEILPRASSRSAVMTTHAAMARAGFRRVAVRFGRLNFDDSEADNERSAEVEALSNQIAQLATELEAERAKSAELELRAVRAEAKSEGANGVLDYLLPQIEKLLTEQARVSLELRAIQASAEKESRGLLSRFRGRQRAD